MSPSFNSNVKTQIDDGQSSSILGKRDSFDLRKHDKEEFESLTKRSKVSPEHLNKTLMTPPRPLGTSKSRTTVPKPKDEFLRAIDVKSVSKNLFFEEFERISNFNDHRILKQSTEGTPFFKKSDSDSTPQNTLFALKKRLNKKLCADLRDLSKLYN